MFALIIYIIAGLGAGIGTGLAGMSAATVISPMLISFLGFDAYEAIGIALASDVLASAVSAYTYAKDGDIDIKNAMVMLVSVILCTMIGSFVASFVPSVTMGSFSVFMMLFLGLRFLFMPVMNTQALQLGKTQEERNIEAIICGGAIGLYCGFIGVGGGMLMLFILTTILKYEVKTAVGTSVFVMTFTAFTGAISHFYIGGMPNMMALITCIIATLIGARASALFGIKADTRQMNRAIGVVLTILAITMIIVKYVI